MDIIGGQFQLHEVIGRGGMGVVYRATDTHTGQSVAVKMLKLETVGNSTEVIERFAREAEALRQLNHPNITKVLTTLHENQQHYIVMEYVPGGSLRSLLYPGGKATPLPIQRILEIALDLADALTRAHRLDIIHRDLKPANILIAADGTPRLTDFGVAYMGQMERVTDVGMALGTMDYLPPEALRDDHIDSRADIWSFGVLLFEMLANRRPFNADTITQVISNILTKPTPDLEALRPDCPTVLADLIYRMLEKERTMRVPSIRLVGAELEALMQATSAMRTANLSVPPATPISTVYERRFMTSPPTSDEPHHNLPTQTTTFVGREAELSELEKLLDDPTVRLITILAPGGMGKTRLGLEVAQRHLHTGHGSYFVALAPVSLPTGIVPAVAAALGFHFHQNGEPVQQLLDYFRSRTLLLVMDNFEHLTAGANLVTDILQAAPGIKILVTSRERLNLSGETVFNLSGMEFPDGQTPADILEYSAVKLFLQSARRTQPDFELQAANLPPVARICSLVGGMPLGILLAASWVGVLSLPEIADEIARNLDFLETSLRDIPERQRSIRAVFEYSWSLLTEAERQVFMKTSVFRSGFMREAAQQVAGASLQHLISLVGKSLLRRNPKTGRYEIHELLRQYAAEQLDRAGETDATRKAASVYYAAFLQQREADLKGHRQVAALDEIELDFPNVRRAWKWAVEQRNLTQLRQMLNGLNIYCDMRSRLVEGFDLFQRAIQPFENATDNDQQYVRNLINVRLIRGQVLATAWNKTEAAAHAALDLCLQQAQARQDRPEIAYCLWTRAITYAFLGDEQTNVASGVAAAEAFLDASRELGDKFYIAEALVWVGVFYLLLGQKETAITYTRQGLDLKNQIGDQHGVSYILYNLSVNLFEGEQYIEAEAYARESVQCMAETRSQKGMTISNFQLAWVLFFKGELAEARQLTEQIIEVSKQIHFPHGELQARFLFAMLLAIMDEQYLEAKCQCDEQQAAIPFYNTGGASYAIVACGLGNYEAARQYHQTVLRNNRFSKSFLGISLALEVLIHAHQGQPERAIEFLGLVSTWPERISGWMNTWPLLTRQRELLATELGTEAYQRAWTRGQKLDVEQVWAELLRL